MSNFKLHSQKRSLWNRSTIKIILMKLQLILQNATTSLIATKSEPSSLIQEACPPSRLTGPERPVHNKMTRQYEWQ